MTMHWTAHSFGLDDEPSTSPRKGPEDSRRLSPGDSAHGHRGGAGLTALLLSQPHHLLAPRPLPEVGDPARNTQSDMPIGSVLSALTPGPGRMQFSLADVCRRIL